MKRIILSTAFLFVAIVAANAQSSFWHFSYPISLGLGETEEFVGTTSFRGFTIDGRGFIRDNISIGGMWSWEVFDEVKRGLPPEPITDDSGNVIGHISGTPYTYLNSIPIMVNGHYYLGDYGAMRPYFGIGIGTVYVDERTDIGYYTIQTQTWRFGLQPEVGVFIPFGLTDAGANISLRYRYGTQGNEDTRALSFLSLTVGVGWMN